MVLSFAFLKDADYGSLCWVRICLRFYVMLTTTIYWEQGPESFLAQLDSEQDGPDVIWNLKMRQSLLDHLTFELESYVKFRTADPLALYIHVPKSPLTYPELEESVFSAPFYIQNLFDNECFPNYQINDPNGFLNSLMQDLRRSAKILANLGAETSTVRKEVPRTHLLFHALVSIIQFATLGCVAIVIFKALLFDQSLHCSHIMYYPIVISNFSSLHF